MKIAANIYGDGHPAETLQTMCVCTLSSTLTTTLCCRYYRNPHLQMGKVRLREIGHLPGYQDPSDLKPSSLLVPLNQV